MAVPTPTPARWLHGRPPAIRTPADILCLTLYALARGRVLRGVMVSTIADRLSIDFYRATEMADAAQAAGLVRHEHGTVALTSDGRERGAALTPQRSKRPRIAAEKRRDERLKAVVRPPTKPGEGSK